MQAYVDFLPENRMHKHILLTNKLTSIAKKKKFPLNHIALYLTILNNFMEAHLTEKQLYL